MDDLEELLRAKSTTSIVLDQDTSQGQGFLSLPTPKTAQPLSLERPTDWRPFFINIETVLTWPVFVDLNFAERPDLRSLLRSDKSHLPTLPFPAGFGLYAAQQLLQKFLDNVHIFNPILEETMVRGYMLASLNGFGWDAQSCLMVTKTTNYFSRTIELTWLAFNLCSWVYLGSVREVAQNGVFWLSPVNRVPSGRVFFLCCSE